MKSGELNLGAVTPADSCDVIDTSRPHLMFDSPQVSVSPVNVWCPLLGSCCNSMTDGISESVCACVVQSSVLVPLTQLFDLHH